MSEMEVEMESDSGGDMSAAIRMSGRPNRPNNTGFGLIGDLSQPSGQSMPYSTQSLSRRMAPNSIGLQMTPTKMLSNTLNNRRSSSGIFITSMFSSRFRHLQKLHSEAFLGLNSICLPGLPMGAVFRSSLPATPVATPIHREAFQQFSEQALRDRLCKTPSPRKNRGFLPLGLQTDQQMRSDSRCSQSGGHDLTDVQPMDITSPIDEPVIEDTKGEECTNGGGFGDHPFGYNDRLHRMHTETDIDGNERRLFVGNISYRVTEAQLSKFFNKFGKVYNCCIVKDHIKKLPKGYGFITFKNICDLQKVLSIEPNKLILDNRALRVFLAKPKVCKQMKEEVKELIDERQVSLEYRNCPQNTVITNIVRHKLSQNGVTFDDLDDDSIVYIFKLLDCLIDQTNLERVCIRWKLLMNQMWSTRTGISFTKSFFSFGSPVLTTSILFTILKKCPNLKSIDLKHVTNYLDIKALEIIAVSCSLLETLIFDSGVTTDYAIKVLGQKCQHLKILHLNDCCHFGEEGFWWLIKSATDIQHLEITNNFKINGNCFRLLSTSLKSLNITNCPKIREKGFKELIDGNRMSLEALSVSTVNQNIMKMICLGLKCLKYLRISQFPTLYPTQDTHTTGFSYLTSLNNLKVLDVSVDFDDINDETLLSILQNCCKIEELILVLNRRVTDSSISQIYKYLPHLHKLVITDSSITNSSLALVSNLEDLTHLDISGSLKVTDSGSQVIVDNCKSLNLFQMNRCPEISSDFLKYSLKVIQNEPLIRDLTIVYDCIRFNLKNETIDGIDDMLKSDDYFNDNNCESNENLLDYNFDIDNQDLN
ncbi:uncharacterized protein LOC128965368 [Oppia nitens]|uniref:uncharacterized protein LOC128965368 n=1 Tax=Oppia nitens TaxID=1686743 RepID=UPI0023DA0D00|nr:uncharacterized protein LOC128965368 [Oppia nitens]